MNNPASSEIVEQVSLFDFAATIEQLVKAIAKAGLQLFAQIDHAAGAHQAGMTMPPSTVLIYGHARGGTPVMLVAPQTALDLPLRVLVRERPDRHTVIAFHPIGPMLRSAGVPEDLAGRLAPAQQILVEAVTS